MGGGITKTLPGAELHVFPIYYIPNAQVTKENAVLATEGYY